MFLFAVKDIIAAFEEHATDVIKPVTKAVDEAQYFPEVREQAIAVRSMLCLQTGDRSKIYQAFTEFAYSQHD